MKEQSNKISIALRAAKADSSWEHQERADYTIEAMEREMKELLSPKKDQQQPKVNLSTTKAS